MKVLHGSIWKTVLITLFCAAVLISAEEKPVVFHPGAGLTAIAHSDAISPGFTLLLGFTFKEQVVLRIGGSYLGPMISSLQRLIPNEGFIESYYLLKKSYPVQLGIGFQLGYFHSIWKTSNQVEEGLLGDYYPSDERHYVFSLPVGYINWGKSDYRRWFATIGPLFGRKSYHKLRYVGGEPYPNPDYKFIAALRISIGFQIGG